MCRENCSVWSVASLSSLPPSLWHFPSARSQLSFAGRGDERQPDAPSFGCGLFVSPVEAAEQSGSALWYCGAPCPEARALSFFLATACVPRICKERNRKQHPEKTGVCSERRSACSYIWRRDGKTYNGTLEHLIISAFLLATNSTIRAALCALTKDERSFFALRGGTQGSGINSAP